MLLAIDLGNSRVTFGLFKGARLARSASKGFASTKGLGGIISTWVGRRAVDGVVVSSVVPSANAALRRACKKLFGVIPLFVSSNNSGMRIRNYNRRQLGADRIVAAVAAYERYKKPVIVVDAGTAITIDLVNRKGEFAGGVIVPGLHAACESLHHVAEKLPLVKPAYTKRVIGKDTRSAINSGIVQGYAGMVDHVVREMKRESGMKATVVATGGDAKLLKKMCRTIDKVYPHLILEGLRIIWELNN